MWLSRNLLLTNFSSGRALAIWWGPVSACFSGSCLLHAQKEFWVILPFHDKGSPPILISFIYYYCRVTQSYQQNTASIEDLAFKTCTHCIGRSWNSSTEGPERQLHSWADMFTTEHFRRASQKETISHLCLEKTRHAPFLHYVYACRINCKVNSLLKKTSNPSYFFR